MDGEQGALSNAESSHRLERFLGNKLNNWFNPGTSGISEDFDPRKWLLHVDMWYQVRAAFSLFWQKSALTCPNRCYLSNSRSLASPVTLFWAYVFVLSKVLELGDTVFLILRKRPLTFLHVFHHSTVLIACWYMPTQNAPAARWFGTINGFVHSIMYTYFTLQILGWYKIPRWISMCLTTMQVRK